MTTRDLRDIRAEELRQAREEELAPALARIDFYHREHGMRAAESSAHAALEYKIRDREGLLRRHWRT